MGIGAPWGKQGVAGARLVVVPGVLPTPGTTTTGNSNRICPCIGRHVRLRLGSPQRLPVVSLSGAEGAGLHPALNRFEKKGEQVQREVEVKYRVADVEALLVVLKTRGILLGDPVHQDDQAYAPVGWVYGNPKQGVPFFRWGTRG